MTDRQTPKGGAALLWQPARLTAVSTPFVTASTRVERTLGVPRAVGRFNSGAV